MVAVISVVIQPLGYLMNVFYTLSDSYGVALILFTLCSKIILLPVSLVAYRNSIRLAMIKPRLDDLKRYYSGDKDRIAEEQLALYKAEKYNPLVDIVPLFIQLFFVIGLIQVIYNPMKYLLQIPSDDIRQIISIISQIADLDISGPYTQLRVIEIIQNTAPDSVISGVSAEWINAIQRFNIHFLGINLYTIPSILLLSSQWSVPVFSGLSSVLLCAVQSRIHVLQRQQSVITQWASGSFFTAFACVFTFIVPAGIGMYWGLGNLLSIPILALSNTICKTNEYIVFSPLPKPSFSTKSMYRELKTRENTDYKRFSAEEGKKLVFYSAKSGVYKYFRSVLEYVLENSDITIHYITSDPNDAIFSTKNPQLATYYIGEKKLISLMMKLDTDMMVMTTPDLEKYHIKRSIIRKDIEYVYMFHTVASMHMTLREGAVDYYDTVFCVGQHQVDEIRKTEEVYNLHRKKLVTCGYGLIDDLIEAYNSSEHIKKDTPQIMVAPSWQADNILDTCIYEILDCLITTDCSIIVRPHPEFIKRFADKTAALLEKVASYPIGRIVVETDFSSNASIYESDIMITDWSNIAFEFSYSTKKPSIFIDTPMKIQNPQYTRLGLEPLDITFRRELGVPVKLGELDKLPSIVDNMLANPHQWESKIEEVIAQYLYNPGRSGKAGGEYIIQALQPKASESE